MNTYTHLLHSIPTDPLTGSLSTPIYQTATFEQIAPGENRGYDYARTGNPTRKVFEQLMTGLEHGAGASAFGSGLSAIDAVLKLLKAGDEIIAVEDIYGGAFRLFTHIYEKFGIRVHYTDTAQTEHVQRYITPRTRLLWVETPTNPTLRISPIRELARLAEAHGLLLCVDNTFASPVSQKPLELGAHLVVHSATKYLAGHSDLIAGVVVSGSEELAERIRFIQNASGAILGPFDSWLAVRGIETLPLRVERQSAGAWKLARYLQNHPLVGQVFYPGLEEHPGHAVAAGQMKYFGGIVSFDLKEDEGAIARRVVTGTRFFKLAESLGGVKSLLCQPSEMTHRSIPPERRLQSGIKDSLIRLSIGLEDADDLIADVEQALDAAHTAILHPEKKQTLCHA
jgi:cystathionine beta-lyase/cystathionine gamma-synthase